MKADRPTRQLVTPTVEIASARITVAYIANVAEIDAVFRVILKLIHTATPDKTRLPRLPVDRRRDGGQADSYA